MWHKTELVKLKSLLDEVSPFGFSVDGTLKKYANKKEAYVDMMMNIATFAPAGYVDVPLIMEVFQEVKCIDAVRLCKRRPEIVRLDIDSVSPEATQVWEDLLRRLLEVTGCEFDKECFIVARAEFILLWAKLKTSQEIIKEHERKKSSEAPEAGND